MFRSDAKLRFIRVGRYEGRMILKDLLLSRHRWTDDETVYVAQPWSCDAEAILVSPAPATTEPVMRSGQSYEYFLEGFIARDFIDDLGAPSSSISVEVCERLIRYAIYDA
jgi:hypothetical protein